MRHYTEPAEQRLKIDIEFVKSVDIRGNTDESWRHGLDYMLRHYVPEVQEVRAI